MAGLLTEHNGFPVRFIPFVVDGTGLVRDGNVVEATGELAPASLATVAADFIPVSSPDVIWLTVIWGHHSVEIPQILAMEVILAEKVIFSFDAGEGLGPPLGVLVLMVEAP